MSIQFEVTDHIGVITINNPPLNLWNSQMSADLTDILDGLMSNKDVRCVIITGIGERAFTAGQDLRAIADGAVNKAAGGFRQARIYLQALQDCPVPVIGAINGYALGHGIAIASACDILIASENAKFGAPEVKVGLSNGHRMMRELFPKGHARFAYFTGEFIDAAEAYRVGAVFRLVPAAELLNEAMAIARQITNISPTSLRVFKDTVRWTDNMDLHTGYRFEGERARLSREDATYMRNEREARAAFREKRDPIFE